MVTKREYLIQKGLAKEGRGRLSAVAHDEIKKAINKGIKFDEAGARSDAGIGGETPRPIRPEGWYTFINPDGRKFKRLHTNACVKCSWSFQWCGCAQGPFQWAFGKGFTEVMLPCAQVAVITTNDVPEKQPERGGGTVVRRGRGRPRGSRTAKAA